MKRRGEEEKEKKGKVCHARVRETERTHGERGDMMETGAGEKEG